VTDRRPTIRRIEETEEQVPPPPAARPAEQRDVPRIAATLTIALADSRWTRWALPADGRMQRLTRLHELDAGHRGVAAGTAWVAGDVSSVAVWAAPDGTPGTRPLPRDVAAALAREMPHLSADRWPAVAATAEVIAAARPEAPHWWLTHLGTRPTARRQGLAAAVLAPALATADGTGTPAAAAVFTWANVRFLRRFGFEVSAALRTPDDELPLWLVLREPVSPSGGAGA
jgi:GNAT superfamily N-acetyltransferase